MSPGHSATAGWGLVGWLGLAASALIAVQAVRNASIAADPSSPSVFARFVWPDHPRVVFAEAFDLIGQRSREGNAPSPELVKRVADASHAAPLALEPLLITAADKLSRGETRSGEALLRAAIRHDPRAPAARFLLADLFFRQGRVAEGIEQVGLLNRRIPDAAVSFAPALARYLALPGTSGSLSLALGRDQKLRSAVMNVLASDPTATSRLLAMADARDRSQPWLVPAIERLLLEGRPALAATLANRTGIAPDLLRPASFANSAKGVGAGWRFPQSSAGAAVISPKGFLQLVYYANERAILAEHLLMLPPGRYRLAHAVTEIEGPTLLEWQVQCLAGGPGTVVSLPVKAGDSATDFAVSSDCAGQKLVVLGVPVEGEQVVTGTIRSIDLRRSDR